MEILREIVRNIALIIILAGFMEMILPDTEMRRYIQMVVGLFVLVSIITPLAQLFTNQKGIEAAAWQYNYEDNTSAILENGKKIAAKEKESIQNEAGKHVAAQITALAKLNNNVDDVNVKVMQDKIKIQLLLKSALSRDEKNSLAERVRETVVAFFGFPAENVEVSY